MKEREFKKLVFENFIQAKKELIREGYIKRNDNLNFEEVFSETKKRVLEERVKSLQRENEMLKKQLKRKGLQEAGSMSAAGQGGAFQGNAPGSEGLWNFITKVSAKLGSTTAKADVIAKQLERTGELQDSDDISKFKIKFITFRKKGFDDLEATEQALKELKAQSSLAENRRRRRY